MALMTRYITGAYHAVVGLLTGAMLAACQGEPPPDWEPEPGLGAELARALRVSATLQVAPADRFGGSFARARAEAARTGAGAEVELAVAGGEVALRATADGLLVVERLEAFFEDVHVPAEIVPPAGVRLTGLLVRIERPLVVAPVEGPRGLTVIAAVDLVAEWAVDLGGGAVAELRPVRLRELPVSIDVGRDGLGRVQLRLVAFRDGEFWQWAETFRLGDLVVDLRAVAE
jgi:hypothetical protein